MSTNEKPRLIHEEYNPYAACDYTSWTAENFDLNEVLSFIQGPIIEIGGPTQSGYPNIFPDMKYVNELPTRQRILISNCSWEYNKPKDIDDSEFTQEDLDYLLEQSNIGKLDFMCDGTKMPFSNESVGAILFSHLPVWPFFNIREYAIEESARVLKHGGLLIAQGIKPVDIALAETLGFTPKIIYRPDNPNRYSDAVFVKVAKTP